MTTASPYDGLERYVPPRPGRRPKSDKPARRPRTSSIQFSRAADLEGRPLPERRWVVPGWIPDHAVTLLSGDGATGKSLLALQLMVACATGGTWLGLPVDRRSSVALLCEEEGDEVHLRLDAICRREGLRLADLTGVHYEPRPGRDNVLMSFTRDGEPRPSKLYHDLVASLLAVDDARLVVIDTLADTFAGNEIMRPQARAFINHMRELASIINGAILLTSHPSVAGQATGTGNSGSTAWNNSVRSRLYLTRPPTAPGERDDPDARVLTRMKANYATKGDELRMRWEEGVFVRQQEPDWIEQRTENAKVDQRFLELLAALRAQGRNVGDKPGKSYAPAIMSGMPDAAGLTRRGLEAAMQRLFAARSIRVIQHGPPSRSVNIIEAVPAAAP